MNKDEKKSDPETDEPSNLLLAELIKQLSDRIEKLEKRLDNDNWNYWGKTKKKCPYCRGSGTVSGRCNPYDPYPHPRYQHHIPSTNHTQ